MNLKKAITQDAIALNLEANDKPGIIQELVDLLVQAGRVKDRETALKAVMDREQKMSTGMHNGIAIPHAKTDIVDGLVAAVGLKKEGMDFEALDGNPSQIFVLTLSPAKRAGPHIQFLAEISRLLNDPGVRERLLEAESREDVLELLTMSTGKNQHRA